MQYGYADDHIKLYNFAFMDLDYTDKDFIYDHIEDFERAYLKMADDRSRRIFVDILNYKITKDAGYLAKMSADVDDEHFQYFPEDIYDHSPQECFLDVGAYIGDTFSVFNEVYSDGWKHYYGLEADSYVFKELQRAIRSSGKHADKISLYKIAAWSEKTTLSFDENAGSSRMSEKDERKANMVDADRIDNILKDAEITFIKMDIEGAEYNALTGMKELIKRNKPILAICVYHLRDDFYKLTDFIEDLMPNQYKYFMRQYRYTPTETVCYMIPNERVL